MKSNQIRSYFWSLSSCIQSKYRKVRTRNNSVFGHFSHIAFFGVTSSLTIVKEKENFMGTNFSREQFRADDFFCGGNISGTYLGYFSRGGFSYFGNKHGMKFSMTNFHDNFPWQNLLRIWSHLLKKSVIENLKNWKNFCAVKKNWNISSKLQISAQHRLVDFMLFFLKDTQKMCSLNI